MKKTKRLAPRSTCTCGSAYCLTCRSTRNVAGDAPSHAGAGHKADHLKDRWELLPLGPIQQIVTVLTYGARKYGEDDNWRKVDNGRDRYYAALMRHVIAWRSGEKADAETGMSPLAHAGACIMFLLELESSGG